jgi:hypothetical protein
MTGGARAFVKGNALPVLRESLRKSRTARRLHERDAEVMR